MLRIRLSRTGRKNQPKFRIVVIEHSRSVKGKALEIVGYYIPTENKEFVFDAERINYWISKGAKPSDAVASLLKQYGVEGMEVYIAPRDKKRPKKADLKAEEVPEKKPEKGETEIAEKEGVPKEERPSEEEKVEPPAEGKKEELEEKKPAEEKKKEAPVEEKVEIEKPAKEEEEKSPPEKKKEKTPLEKEKEKTEEIGKPPKEEKKEESLEK